MAELTIKLGDTVLQTHAFDGELLRIGRSRENDVVLENLSVSRHHVQIRYHEGHYVLFDMNSSNGTFLNGTRITRRELLDGDQITIGKHVLLWHDTSEQSTVLDDPQSRPPTPAKAARAKDARAEAWVRVDSGRLKDREFKVIRFETTLGKAATNDIVLTDDWLLAKKQAIILRKGNDEFEIQDLGGIRRVKVNGHPVDQKAPLRTGDKLELGGTRMVFYSTAAKHPSAPAQIILKNPQDAAAEAPAEPEAPENEPAVAALAPLPAEDSLDLEELFEPAALVAREIMASTNGNGSHSHAEGSSNGSGRYGATGASASQRSAVAEVAPAHNELPARVAASSDDSPASPTFDKIKSGASDKEVEMWESALDNPSPAIRRQAARMLKKLTGRDYGV